MMSRQNAALRGLAILIVILNHSIYIGTTQLQDWNFPTPTGLGKSILLFLSQFGVFAVPTFLFVSGCFFAYAARGQKANFSWKFLLTNIAHLLWPYLIWSGIFYLLIFLSEGKTFTFPGYIKNLIVGYPFNFIPIMIFWYILSPLITRAGRRLSFFIIIIIGIYQVILINLVYPGMYGFYFPQWMKWLAPPVIRVPLADWGIYFPLGLVFSLYSSEITPLLRKLQPVLIIATILSFFVSILNQFSVIILPWINFVCPLAFAFLIPTIKRENIPMVHFLEDIGKKSYGLYLTNLIVLEVILILIKLIFPQAFDLQIGLYPILFALTLGIPMLIMNSLSRLSRRNLYSIVFG